MNGCYVRTVWSLLVTFSRVVTGRLKRKDESTKGSGRWRPIHVYVLESAAESGGLASRVINNRTASTLRRFCLVGGRSEFNVT